MLRRRFVLPEIGWSRRRVEIPCVTIAVVTNVTVSLVNAGIRPRVLSRVITVVWMAIHEELSRCHIHLFGSTRYSVAVTWIRSAKNLVESRRRHRIIAWVAMKVTVWIVQTSANRIVVVGMVLVLLVGYIVRL